MEKIQATVGILTFNSGKVLQRALDSVKEFDEIVICDGGSTDDTVEIARAAGARIILQDAKFKNSNGTLNDFGGVRQQCLDAATHDWFLYIDSDETISDGLREEIRKVTSEPNQPGMPLVYKVPYGICMDGRPIRYASNFPGYQYRFFNRTSGAKFIKKVHERITFDVEKVSIGILTNPWYTYARRADAWNYLRDTRAYRRLEVRMFRNRSSADVMKFVVLGGLRTFLGATLKATRNYFLHGFRDSAPIGDEVGRALSPMLLIGGVLQDRLLHAKLVSNFIELSKVCAWKLFPQFFLQRTFKHIIHPTKDDIAKRRAEAELFIIPGLLARAPQAAFFDVGANIGSYVYVASKHISQKHIYAFEPQLAYIRRLRALFPKSTIEAVALSSKVTSAEFKIPEIHGRAYPTRGTLEHFKEEGEDHSTFQTVALTTLDSYCKEHSITEIGVLKIDVEGHELAVLQGAQEMLKKSQPRIIVEIEQRHHTEPIEQIFEFVQSFGYAGWFFDSASEKFLSLQEFSVETHQRAVDFKTAAQVNNFLFLPEGELPPVLSIFTSS